MFRGLCIVVILALSAFANEAEMESKANAAYRKCYEEQKFTEEPSGTFNQAIISSPKMKCFVACVWREMGSINEDNSFNVTQWIESSPNMTAERIQSLNECSAEKDPNVCETAYKFYICLQNKGVRI